MLPAKQDKKNPTDTEHISVINVFIKADRHISKNL